MRRQTTENVDAQDAARAPIGRGRSGHSLADLQRSVGNRGVNALLQRKIAYGDDWSSLWGMAWAAGAKEIWAKLQPAFDERLMPVLARLEKMLETHAMSDDQRKRIVELNEEWGKFDSEKIPLQKGRDLLGRIDKLTEEAAGLEKAVKEGLTKLVDEIRSRVEETTSPFFAAYPNWSQYDIPGLAEANTDRKQLQARLTAAASRKALSGAELAALGESADAVVSVFRASAALAGEKKRSADAEKKAADATGQPTKTPEARPEPAPDRLLAKLGRSGRPMAASLRATGTTDDDLLTLLERTDITTGRLAEVLRFCAAGHVATLLALTTDEWLVKHFAAVGAKGHETQLADILQLAPRQDDHVHLLLARAGKGQLDYVREVLTLFPADASRAENAAALFAEGARGQVAEVLTLLRRVGVAAAPTLVALFKTVTAQELDFLLDPEKAGHSFEFVTTELAQGHRIWAGATTPEPQCLLHDGTATTWTHVRDHAVMYHPNGFPAPRTGMFSADRFGNHGGANDMKLPTNTTYTEYDLREYTSEAERGTRRMVVGANGARYYTPDHYKTFFKVS